MTVRILVLAGEPSGDLHGSRVITALRRRFPHAVIEAVGGPRMAGAGAVILHSLDGLAAIGFLEVHKVPTHLALLRQLRKRFRKKRYDLVIPVDYPGFHLLVAEAAKQQGIPVLWYIAPQHWAWRPGRAVRFARAVDRLAVILPFEAEFFRERGVGATYVGHPLLDRDPPPSRASAREALNLPAGARVLALFPGSRRGEIARLWPAYRGAAVRLLADGRCTHVIVAATAWGDYPDAGALQLVRDDPAKVLAAADAVLAKSGTTTLEAALADVPMVVAYRMHPLSYRVISRLATVRWASLVNLVANREVVPELIQDAVTVESLVSTIAPLLDPTSAAHRQQREGLAEVRQRLGRPGASEHVAQLAADLLAA